ncbi:MAG TPA: UDP-N-acetylglucosamine--N-acetylmuramyl-(pentapeptide) pyrophosphoryl-undecaprenol N-acetylglucosamine transferase [Acidimicrobiia bacterium]|nr:UDP-N-acetylglucosamine--N-acetylmuramyl-(pentapeptide) pyrophosphoryl-undecaprenol N-acetylglucosamine transferase [Acidimicrobiia bacterium]
MTYLIAAAGTGGHVFPGLAVGEALLELGVAQEDVMYVGGDRLEAEVYPDHGFHFFSVELAGLKRSLTLQNARIPGVVARARNAISSEIEDRKVRVVLGMGGYVTVPAGLAARRNRVPLFNAEQNAGAGLANRIAARWARRTFTSFPETRGLPGAEWTGNPVREAFWTFDRAGLSPTAHDHFGLDPDRRTVGVFGGSLGAGAINEAIADCLSTWSGPEVNVVHLTGAAHLDEMDSRDAHPSVRWVRRGFEDRMELFYAASDLVVARAGGAVAELTATATPSILVPGDFGSGGHQTENATALVRIGAAEVVAQADLARLGGFLEGLIADEDRLATMASATAALAKPEAALTIANVMIEAAR